MSSKTRLHRSGQLLGKGADLKVFLGYKPRYVEVINVTDRISFKKYDSMVADKALQTIADGTATYADRITINSDGFTVLAAAAISAKEIHYYADESNNES